MRGIVALSGGVRVERYRYTVPGHGDLVWDVLRAKEEVRLGHVLATIELPRDEQQNIMERCDWDPTHLPHVDITQPGIAAPFVWEGAIMYVPIDGIHRITRAYREHRTFYMHCLTDAASKAAFLEGPEYLMPWAADATKAVPR